MENVPLSADDYEVVVWLLDEARQNIAELEDDLRDFYIPDKGWPPHIVRAQEIRAEIKDFLASHGIG